MQSITSIDEIDAKKKKKNLKKTSTHHNKNTQQTKTKRELPQQ